MYAVVCHNENDEPDVYGPFETKALAQEYIDGWLSVDEYTVKEDLSIHVLNRPTRWWLDAEKVAPFLTGKEG